MTDFLGFGRYAKSHGRKQGGSRQVLGIGGVFLKSADHTRLRFWYAQNLAIDSGEYGTSFQWRAHDRSETEHQTTSFRLGQIISIRVRRCS